MMVSQPVAGVKFDRLSIQATGVRIVPYETGVRRGFGYGFGCRAYWDVGMGWRIGLLNQHWYAPLEQQNAIIQWGWDYWLKIYGNAVYEARQDPVYRMELKPRQALQVKPVLLMIDKRVARFGGLALFTGAGVGAAWYSRQLWLEEKWEKDFPSIGYTYAYSFRNHADPRRGWVGVSRLALRLQWDKNDRFAIGFSAGYESFNRNRKDAARFPLSKIIDGNIELQLRY